MKRQELDNGLAPLVNILVSGLASDRSSSLCRETSLSGSQQQPVGRARHKPQLLSYTVLLIGATGALTLTAAAGGQVCLLALFGSRYTPACSHQWNQLGLQRAATGSILDKIQRQQN